MLKHLNIVGMNIDFNLKYRIHHDDVKKREKIVREICIKLFKSSSGFFSRWTSPLSLMPFRPFMNMNMYVRCTYLELRLDVVHKIYSLKRGEIV